MSALSVFNLVLLAACGGLGWLAYERHAAPPAELPQWETAGRKAQDAAAAPGFRPFRMPPQQTFSELVERPPFSQSRRPPEVKVTRETRQAPVRKQLSFSLIGVILQPNKQYALVRQAGKKEILRLGRGEKIDGWLVDSILPDRLVLSYAEDVVELELKDAKIKRPTVQRRKAQRDRARQAAQEQPAPASAPLRQPDGRPAEEAAPGAAEPPQPGADQAERTD